MEFNNYLLTLLPHPLGIVFNNQLNPRAQIGQSAMVYCASKLMEISQ